MISELEREHNLGLFVKCNSIVHSEESGERTVNLAGCTVSLLSYWRFACRLSSVSVTVYTELNSMIAVIRNLFCLLCLLFYRLSLFGLPPDCMLTMFPWKWKVRSLC